MTEVYTREQGLASADPPERRGISVVKPIEAAKEAVSVEELAERLTGPGQGRRRAIAFVCPFHDDHDPSLMVDPEKQVWHCFPCGFGGDVVEMARRAWGYSDGGRGAAEAAAYLLLEFGHQPPERPPAWFPKQERQRSIRDRIDAEKIEHIRMLVFRLIWMPWLRRLPEWARDEASESAWAASRPMALLLYEQRRGA